jgi:hypothetical protein
MTGRDIPRLLLLATVVLAAACEWTKSESSPTDPLGGNPSFRRNPWGLVLEQDSQGIPLGPIAGATVTLRESTAITDKDGIFEFSDRAGWNSPSGPRFRDICAVAPGFDRGCQLAGFYTEIKLFRSKDQPPE